MKERLLIIIGFLSFLLFVGFLGSWESQYSRLATCIGYTNNTYTFMDNGGNSWEWTKKDNNNFIIGDTYKLIMDDNHTSSIYDDIIKKIKKD